MQTDDSLWYARSIMSVDPDPYLAELDAEGKALDDEETRLEANYKASREDIARRRDINEHARHHFLNYLKKTGALQTAAPLQIAKPALPGASPSDPIPLPLRMGDQRRLMLDAIADSPDGVTALEVAKATGIQPKVIYTYIQREIAAGILLRRSDVAGTRLVLTPRGKDYMARVQEKWPREAPKAPPAEPEESFSEF